MRLIGFTLLLTVFADAAAGAQPLPTFASVFGTGMVLPYGEPVTLQGQAAPNIKLVLGISDKQYGIRSDARGAWHLQVPALRAGGPYTITLRDENGAGATLTDVLAGEVWLCSGQSNSPFLWQY